MSLADEVYGASDDVRSAGAGVLGDELIRFIERYVTPSFVVTAASIKDDDGKTTDSYAAVVHTADDGSRVAVEAGIVRANDAAAAICAIETLDVERLRTSYEQLRQAKQLRKHPVPNGLPRSNRTLSIIVAQRSSLPMETVALELERLNGQSPDAEWPDMVAVASTGTVQYAVQWPSEGLSGDFLPPAEGALQAYTPPMYVVMVLRPSGERTLNRMLAFILAHLAFVAPGARLPRWDEVLEGVSRSAVVVTGYQYNQAGALVPVPEQYYGDRYLATPPLRIEDRSGNLLSTVELIPWQDGGVILMRGKLPLEALLMFFNGQTTKRVGRVKRPGAEISFALPITAAGFDGMLRQFQRQSNMVVRPPNIQWVIQKAAEEGSESPFMARLLIGVFRLRDAAFSESADRLRFDKRYDVALSAWFTARSAAQEVQRLWAEHSRKVSSGEIARIDGQSIRIDESIERELRQQVETFVNASVRAVKQGMQGVARELLVGVGFLFQQQPAFENGVSAMDATDARLAEYLRQTRSSWSELLVERRNHVEHDGWVLPNVRYRRTTDGVAAEEPEIDGCPASEFVEFMLDRITCFIEELTAHCLQDFLPDEVTITEIARAERIRVSPERFRLTVENGGLPSWEIAYHATRFEET